VSCYELALAHRRGRLELPCAPADWFAEELAPAGIALPPLSLAIVLRPVSLTDIHRDPFDRLIIATALEHGPELASLDTLFARPDYQ
jgi:PIN domain nuclease of toxin-antitoxin system